jgi:hypothetical protein
VSGVQWDAHHLRRGNSTTLQRVRVGFFFCIIVVIIVVTRRSCNNSNSTTISN